MCCAFQKSVELIPDFAILNRHFNRRIVNRVIKSVFLSSLKNSTPLLYTKLFMEDDLRDF